MVFLKSLKIDFPRTNRTASVLFLELLFFNVFKNPLKPKFHITSTHGRWSVRIRYRNTRHKSRSRFLAWWEVREVLPQVTIDNKNIFREWDGCHTGIACPYRCVHHLTSVKERDTISGLVKLAHQVTATCSLGFLFGWTDNFSLGQLPTFRLNALCVFHYGYSLWDIRIFAESIVRKITFPRKNAKSDNWSMIVVHEIIVHW